MEKSNFIKKSKLNKEDFLGEKRINIKPVILKTIGNVELYELTEYNILEFCNFATKFLQDNKKLLEKGEAYYTIEDRIKVLNMFTNVNLQNFNKNDIIEILINSSDDVLKAETELLHEIIPDLINKSAKDGLEEVLKMSEIEQVDMVKQIKKDTGIEINEKNLLKDIENYKKQKKIGE